MLIGFFLCPCGVCLSLTNRISVKMKSGLIFGIMLFTMYQFLKLFFFIDQEMFIKHSKSPILTLPKHHKDTNSTVGNLTDHVDSAVLGY